MKKLLITTLVLLGAFSFTFAQQATESNNKTKSNRNEITVTKGYYSIYKNSEKLNKRRPVTTIMVDTNTPAANNYTKGFYAIGDNHRNVHKSGKSFIAITPKRPVATKGYYSVQPSVNKQLVNGDNIAELATSDNSVTNTQDSVQMDR